ncbi:MAG TPA: hypothetical protein VGD83_03450 [Streptosporangiaceae bacterium]
MTYGHRTGYTGDPVVDRVAPLPEDLDPLLGIYVAHMGPICANGLLHAAADLCGPGVRSLGDGVRGRRVVVVGAGVVALLTALLARRHGAASVVVLDATPGRRAVAGALGLESLDPEGPDDAAASLKTRCGTPRAIEGRTWCSSAAGSRRPAPGVAGGPPAGNSDRSGLLPGRAPLGLARSSTTTAWRPVHPDRPDRAPVERP